MDSEIPVVAPRRPQVHDSERLQTLDNIVRSGLRRAHPRGRTAEFGDQYPINYYLGLSVARRLGHAGYSDRRAGHTIHTQRTEKLRERHAVDGQLRRELVGKWHTANSDAPLRLERCDTMLERVCALGAHTTIDEQEDEACARKRAVAQSQME